MPSKKPRTVKPRTPVTPPPLVVKADPTVRLPEDGDFAALRRQVQTCFAAIPASTPLFCVDTSTLFQRFIDNLPPSLRQHYTCRCCRQFIERFGGLVTIGKDNGVTASAVWNFVAAAPYTAAIEALRITVATLPVIAAHVSADTVYGTSSSNGWDHFAVVPQRVRVHTSPFKSVAAVAAERREETEMLRRGLVEFDRDVIQRTLALLKSGGLTRPEKGEPMAQWLLNTHDLVTSVKRAQARDNLLWHIAATAPAGFTHIKSSVLGTLLADVAANLPMADIQRRWAEKLDPMQYMRAQVAPTTGNLKRAETIIQTMEAAGSLRRRYAVRADVAVTLWSQRRDASVVDVTDSKSSTNGTVFGHITPKQRQASTTAPQDLPQVKMTWDKFQRTLMRDAISIEYHVPPVSTPVQLAALVTAVDPTSPPILQWDCVDDTAPHGTASRNPVSIYSTQAQPSAWGLQTDSWVSVDFVTPMPYNWHGTASNHKEGVLLALRGCRDTARTAGGGFLPEFLRSEFREIRASLDAYARSVVVEGRDTAEACGLALMKTSEIAAPATARPAFSTETRVLLVFDESGSMSSHERQINHQAEVIRQQLAAALPNAMIEVCRFGNHVDWDRSSVSTAATMRPLRLGSSRGMTALHDALYSAVDRASMSSTPTLIYLFTDGEENSSQRANAASCQQAVASAIESGRVTFGCVGPRTAAGFFEACGIPSACVRSWDGNSRDLDVVTQQVAQGIRAYADARSQGRGSIDDFFTAPTSGFGPDGVRLRVTTGSGKSRQRQVVVLDRWD